MASSTPAQMSASTDVESDIPITSPIWPRKLRECCRHGAEQIALRMLSDMRTHIAAVENGSQRDLSGHASVNSLKASLNAADSLKHTPLMLAARRGCAQLCSVLIAEGADATIVASWKDPFSNPSTISTTALHEACDSGSCETVETILQAGADVNYQCSPDQFAPLHVTLTSNRRGLASIVRLLLKNGADPDIKSANGLTPLIWSVSSPRVATLRDECQQAAIALIQANATINGISDLITCSPLHCAAALGLDEVVDALIKAKADLELPGEDGTSPLLVSIANGRTNVALALIKAGADVSKRRKNGSSTALHWGAGKGNYTVVKALLEAGAGVNALDNHCVTPLLAAASRGHLEIVRYLLRQGGNDKLFNLDGHTPLHLAEGKGHLAAAHFLRTWRLHYMPLRRHVILKRERFLREHPELDTRTKLPPSPVQQES